MFRIGRVLRSKSYYALLTTSLQSIYKSTDVYASSKPHFIHLYHTKTNTMKNSVQVNVPAESGEMGILAQHVPSIEQLKPGLIEVIEEAGGSKQFFCMFLTSLSMAAPD